MKKFFLVVLLICALGFSGIARADILSPIGPQNEKITATPMAFNSGTLLADVGQVINYLGVKEGEAYSFNQHKWVTTTGATIISLPLNFSIGVSMLDTDGVTGNIEWNVGAYLPVASVPIMKYTQYLYVFGGAGGEENSARTSFKFTSVAGAEFKFAF